ncbi:MAG TPA: hypothetical protein PKL14_12205 [Holophaga sp.]|nr:hypothetical protein [Holophaga sp.]
MSVGMGRIGSAVSDLAETLKRVFQAPSSRDVEMRLPEPRAGEVAVLACEGRSAEFHLASSPQSAALAFPAGGTEEPMVFSASIQAEEAWTQWAAGALVCEMQVFRAGGCARLDVPSLPRKASVRRGEMSALRSVSRGWREPIQAPPTRRADPSFVSPGVRAGLRLVLGMPVAIPPLEMNRALTMRYTLQLVRSSGENIRNLEVLGLYRIPTRGVRSLRHDAKTGRVLLELGSEASGVRREPFILARRKTDLSFVSSFVEE